MQTVIDNILLNYEIFGKDNPKAVLILHGWGQNLSNWITVAQLLAVNHKVVCLDLPGFGGSSLPQNIYGTKEYSLLVDKFIKKLALKNIVIIGHSFGGKIAIDLASHTESFDKLILISPSGIEMRGNFTKAKIIMFKIIKHLLFLYPDQQKTKLFERFGSIDYRNSGPLREIFKKIVREDVRNEAIKIKTNTIIIWGEHDKEVNIKNSLILKGLINKSILRICWKLGHSPNTENPEKLVDIITEYI